MFSFKKDQMVNPDAALKGRTTPMSISGNHYVLSTPMKGPYPDNAQTIILGLGCFWGAERQFWQLEGVFTTAVGYSAGFTPHPTYEEVCSGQTGHNEVVLVVYDSDVISTQEVLKVFWESHNPTQGMRQGNDRGTQYRSGIYYLNDEQRDLAQITQARYQTAIDDHIGNTTDITTEIQAAGEFYFAEEYHQQYLAKNPNGYCGLGGLGLNLV